MPSGNETSKHFNVSLLGYLHGSLLCSFLSRIITEEGAHLPSPRVGLHHSGGALDLLVLLLLLRGGNREKSHFKKLSEDCGPYV